VTRAVVAVVLVAAAQAAIARPARADDLVSTLSDATSTLTPVDLEFPESTVVTDAAAKAVSTRTDAVLACQARLGQSDLAALAMVVIDKAGKTTKVSVGGSGRPALDRCLEKAIKPARWPATRRGGVVALRVVAAGTVDAVVGGLTTTGGGLGTGTVSKDDAGGSISVGTITSGNTSFVDQALKIVHARQNLLRSCYRRRLEQVADLRGPVAFKLVVGSDGKVRSARSTTKIDQDLATCMTGVFRRLVFPAPGAEVELLVPLSMTPP